MSTTVGCSRIEGGCHCGNIRFLVWWPSGVVMPARACSCSFCRPRRATYTSHAEARVEVTIADQRWLSRYRFGTETADFFICGRCGGAPLAVSEIGGRLFAVVNVLFFDGADAMDFDVKATDFDGESVGERLQRRRRNWIADVRIECREC